LNIGSKAEALSSAASMAAIMSPRNEGGGRTHRRMEQDALKRMLTSDISHAHSLLEMEALMEQHGSSMNVIHITAFLSRCASSRVSPRMCMWPVIFETGVTCGLAHFFEHARAQLFCTYFCKLRT